LLPGWVTEGQFSRNLAVHVTDAVPVFPRRPLWITLGNCGRCPAVNTPLEFIDPAAALVQLQVKLRPLTAC